MPRPPAAARDPSLAAAARRILEFDRRRRELLAARESLKAERNAASDEVARRKRAKEPADELMARLKAWEEVKAFDAELREVEAALDQRALDAAELPPAPKRPTATHARIVSSAPGASRRASTSRRSPIGSSARALGILDFAGRRQALRRGLPAAARRRCAALARARQLHARPPHPRARLRGDRAAVPGQPRVASSAPASCPSSRRTCTRMPADDLFLIPTAEVPVTNLHRDEILDAATCRSATCAYTPCFRREAGAPARTPAGSSACTSSTRSSWCASAVPRDSAAEHELLTRHAETVLQRLELPYRVVELAAGDIGFAQRAHLRPRSLGAGRGRLARGLELRAPSPTSRPAAPTSASAPRRGESPIRAHPQRLGPGIPPDHHRPPGEQPASRRIGADPGGAGAVPRDPARRSPRSTASSDGSRPRWWSRWRDCSRRSKDRPSDSSGTSRSTPPPRAASTAASSAPSATRARGSRPRRSSDWATRCGRSACRSWSPTAPAESPRSRISR